MSIPTLYIAEIKSAISASEREFFAMSPTIVSISCLDNLLLSSFFLMKNKLFDDGEIETSTCCPVFKLRISFSSKETAISFSPTNPPTILTIVEIFLGFLCRVFMRILSL